jgi:predicted NBD/HSP70 family sugar kinase
MVDLLEPDVMILGGGVAALLRPYFGHIKESLSEWSVNPRVQEIPLVGAHFGIDAGIAGAAALLAETA